MALKCSVQIRLLETRDFHFLVQIWGLCFKKRHLKWPYGWLWSIWLCCRDSRIYQIPTQCLRMHTCRWVCHQQTRKYFPWTAPGGDQRKGLQALLFPCCCLASFLALLFLRASWWRGWEASEHPGRTALVNVRDSRWIPNLWYCRTCLVPL